MTKLKIPPKLIIGLVILSVLTVVAGLAWRFGYVSRLGILETFKNSSGGVEGLTAKEVKPSVFKEVTKPVYLSPQNISFKDKLLGVEEVGVEEGGILGVPSDWYAAGWYKDGAKAGEDGNVIIDGHYDTNTGAPGAFWELKDLQVGDKVSLTDSLGRRFDYVVREQLSISITDPERAKVFASSQAKELTLITCGGVWDYASGTYNKRLVIKAEFDKMEKSW